MHWHIDNVGTAHHDRRCFKNPDKCGLSRLQELVQLALVRRAPEFIEMVKLICLPRGLAVALALMAAPSLWSADAFAAGPDTCRPPLEHWVEINLYFGRDIAGGGEVSEQQFNDFLTYHVTPRFPDGLSVLDVVGQFSDAGAITREKSKLLVVLVPNAKDAAHRVKLIVDEYKQIFSQTSVLHTETRTCLSFD